MSEIIIDCTRLVAEEAPKSVEEFKPLRGQARIFKNGITNEHALGLNFETAKDLLPNDEIDLSFSLLNDNLQMQCRLHDFLDYSVGKQDLDVTGHELNSGRTFSRNFTDEPIYLFQYNCNHDPMLSKFVTCPEFVGDWFDKYMPMFKHAVVYGSTHTWYFIGPKGTKTELHTDHDFAHTTIQQLDGEKRFFLCSPQDYMRVQKTLGSILEQIEFKLIDNNHCKVLSLKGDPDLNIFNDINILCGDLQKHDLVYLPNGWGHYAESLTPSFSVSRDFIDETNADAYFFSGVFVSELFAKAKYNISVQELTKMYIEYELLQEA